MQASLAATTSLIAAHQGAASTAVGAGSLADANDDASDAFAGLVGEASGAGLSAPVPSPLAAGPSPPGPADLQTLSQSGEQPDLRPGAALDGPGVPATAGLPAALLGFLTQAQAQVQGGGGADDRTTPAGQSDSAALADGAAQEAAGATATAPPPPLAAVVQKRTPPVAATPPAAPPSTAATTPVATAPAAQSKDAAPIPKGSDGKGNAKSDRDKAAAAAAQANATPSLIALMAVPGQPAITDAPPAANDATAAATAPESLQAVTSGGAPSGLPPQATSDPDTTQGSAFAALALGAPQKASPPNAPPTTPAAAKATPAATDAQPQAVAVPASSSPATAPADLPSSSAAAAPSTGQSGSPPPPIVAQSQAASASAAAPPRFAAAKSTAATTFKAAPASGRSAGAPTASPTSAKASEPAGPDGDRATLHAEAPPSQGDDGSPSPGGAAVTPIDPGLLAVGASPDGAAASSTAAPADASALARPGAETAANLSAQIVQKLSGQTTRFDLQLNPNGLGRVDVAVQIDAKGVLSAALSFEKPEAASLLQAHAGDLQQSLAQAGFHLSNGALSFSTADQNGRGGAQSFFAGDFNGGQNAGQNHGGSQGRSAGLAFGAASLAAANTDHIAVQSQGLSARGVDIRI